MPVLCLEFFGFENKAMDDEEGYYQFIALKHVVCNLYERISSIFLGKKRVESNFINNNGDLIFFFI